MYAPVIHLWIRLTSFKNLSSGPARILTFVRRTVGSRQWAWHGASYYGEVQKLSLVLHVLGTLSDLSNGTTEAFQLNDISVQ